MMMMVDLNQAVIDMDDDDDSDRTDIYTPPPLDSTSELNISHNSEKENHDGNYRKSSPIKQQSIIILDDDSEEEIIQEKVSPIPELANSEQNNYWDQWPIDTDVFYPPVYSIPEEDDSPALSQPFPSPVSKTSPVTTDILDILNRSLSLVKPILTNRSKPTTTRKKKTKKKKKLMSEYRPPSPFSPKPDYKSMPIDAMKKQAIRYGLSTTQAKGRLIKILNEIYDFTHQYETDSDFEYEPIDRHSNKNDLSHTPPTPAVVQDTKKSKKRPALHQMSSSDEVDDQPPPAKKPTTATDGKSDSDNSDHEGRFLEMTVYALSSSTSSSSISIDTTPTVLPLDSKKTKSKSKTTSKKATKLVEPTVPLKEIVQNYITNNPLLHARILCYEPIDFEDFHKQLKTELNLKIASKQLMQCLDDQCITFTLRSRKGAFTSVMRAKRRQ